MLERMMKANEFLSNPVNNKPGRNNKKDLVPELPSRIS